MEFCSATKKNETLPFAGKWMELENFIWSEGNQVQKVKSYMFSLICGIQTYKQYYIKQVTFSGHIQEREATRRKFRRWISLMYSLYKNECRIFKPVETTIRRD
jgi:hypothetical protein